MITQQYGQRRGVDSLADRLQTLRDLVPQNQQGDIDELLRRLRLHRFRVLVVGEAKRGKSTVINALLHRPVLPMGVIPVTALTTTVTWGQPERIVVDEQGTVTEHPLARVADFVAEDRNPGNGRGVREVTVLLDHPLLRPGLELVDTPGTGSSGPHDAEAEQALSRADAAIFVLTADPPISTRERELIRRVRDSSVRTFVLLNKVDYIAAEERDRVQSFVRRGLSDVGSDNVTVHPCSARGALAGDERWTDLGGFATVFEDYLTTSQNSDLVRSIRRRGRRAALATLDSVRMGERLLTLQADERASTLASLRETMSVIDQRQREARDLVLAGVRHLKTDTDSAAERVTVSVTERVLTEVQAYVDHDLAAAHNTEVRTAGREHAAQRARAAVDAWRSDCQRRLEQALCDLETRLLTDLDNTMDDLRRQVRMLLDVDLVAENDDSRLVPARGFFYQLGENPRWESPFTVLQERLPGRAGRRRAVAWVRSQAADLVARQVGRVRADLQYRLEESGRALCRAVDARYAAATSAVRTALKEARIERDHDASQHAVHRTDLAQRRAALIMIAQTMATADDQPLSPVPQSGTSQLDEREGCDAADNAGRQDDPSSRRP